MKNLRNTFLLIIGFSAALNAQSVVSLQPNPSSATGTVDQPDVEAHGEITNLTAATIQMKWERNVINLTPGCETAVCDPNTCWARFIGNRNFDMDPNETGQMLVHFYNNGAPCAGIVHVKVTNRNNPNDTIVGVYLFNQSTGVKDLPAANVKLFPNPVVEYFSLDNAENVAVVRVFALDGREVVRFDAVPGSTYSLLNQPAGNYVVALEDKNGVTFQALEIKKQ